MISLGREGKRSSSASDFYAIGYRSVSHSEAHDAESAKQFVISDTRGDSPGLGSAMILNCSSTSPDIISS